MSLSEEMLALIDQRIRAAQLKEKAAGTCVTRATTGPDATVMFDGSTVPMPVKVLGTVFCKPDDRVILDKYGSDWVVTGSWAGLGLGEASYNFFGTPTQTTTSGAYADIPQSGSFIFTKVYDATYMRLGMTAGCYSTAVTTRVQFGLRLTALDAGSTYVASDYATSFIHFNVAGQHMSHYGLLRLVNIPAGAYTVQPRWRRVSGAGTLTIDDGDRFHCEVDENVRQLTPFL